MLTDHPDYDQFEHFWVPGVLHDYDVPDLPALAAPRPAAVLDPVDHMGRRLPASAIRKHFAFARSTYAVLDRSENLLLARTSGRADSVGRRVAEVFRRTP